MKKLNKIMAMGLAAFMAVSSMGISSMANDENDSWDFYTTRQILTYNPTTNEFDSTFEECSPFTLFTSGFTFTFDQNITTSGTFLENTSSTVQGTEQLYLVGSDDTMCITLDNRPGQTVTVQLYKPTTNVLLGPTGEIMSRQTEIVLNGLGDYYNNIGSLRVKMKTASSTINVSGTITEE